jgi:hypothetical protein
VVVGLTAWLWGRRRSRERLASGGQVGGSGVVEVRGGKEAEARGESLEEGEAVADGRGGG